MSPADVRALRDRVVRAASMLDTAAASRRQYIRAGFVGDAARELRELVQQLDALQLDAWADDGRPWLVVPKRGVVELDQADEDDGERFHLQVLAEHGEEHTCEHCGAVLPFELGPAVADACCNCGERFALVVVDPELAAELACPHCGHPHTGDVCDVPGCESCKPSPVRRGDRVLVWGKRVGVVKDAGRGAPTYGAGPGVWSNGERAPSQDDSPVYPRGRVLVELVDGTDPPAGYSAWFPVAELQHAPPEVAHG